MMLLERWLVAAVVGLTVPLVSIAGGVSGQQPSSNTHTKKPIKSGTGQDAVPAKAVIDPNAPPPPDDPKAQPRKTDDDLAPPPDAGEDQASQGATAAKTADTQNSAKPKATAASPTQDVSGRVAPTTGPAVNPAVQGADNQNVVGPNSDSATREQKSSAVQAAAVPGKPAEIVDPERQSKYDKETTELLHLVQELRVEVEKAGANTLSLAALRKADEIQRIAKDLKEKMKEQGQAVASKP